MTQILRVKSQDYKQIARLKRLFEQNSSRDQIFEYQSQTLVGNVAAGLNTLSFDFSPQGDLANFDFVLVRFYLNPQINLVSTGPGTGLRILTQFATVVSPAAFTTSVDAASTLADLTGSFILRQPLLTVEALVTKEAILADVISLNYEITPTLWTNVTSAALSVRVDAVFEYILNPALAIP